MAVRRKITNKRKDNKIFGKTSQRVLKSNRPTNKRCGIRR